VLNLILKTSCESSIRRTTSEFFFGKKNSEPLIKHEDAFTELIETRKETDRLRAELLENVCIFRYPFCITPEKFLSLFRRTQK
jgi:hypothetical protein